MRKGSYAPGAIETGMLQMAHCQMARFYRVPSGGYIGLTNAHLDDAQSGYETGMGMDLFNMALLYARQGERERALPLAEQAAELLAQASSPQAQQAQELVARLQSIVDNSREIGNMIPPVGGKALGGRHVSELLRGRTKVMADKGGGAQGPAPFNRVDRMART